MKNWRAYKKLFGRLNQEVTAILAEHDISFKFYYVRKERAIFISWFARRTNQDGAGAKFLNEFLKIADNYKFNVSLNLKCDATGDNPGLRSYYERFGFRVCGICNKTGLPKMFRSFKD